MPYGFTNAFTPATAARRPITDAPNPNAKRPVPSPGTFGFRAELHPVRMACDLPARRLDDPAGPDGVHEAHDAVRRRRDTVANRAAYAIRVRDGVGLEFDDHGYLFGAEPLVEQPERDHAPGVHAGDALDRGLDVLWVQVRAADDDHVLAAAGHVEFAVGQVPVVAGKEPPVGKRRCGHVRPAVVLGQHALATNRD